MLGQVAAAAEELEVDVEDETVLVAETDEDLLMVMKPELGLPVPSGCVPLGICPAGRWHSRHTAACSI